MTYVFWQGIISIHQKSFLEAVAEKAAGGSVLLVVEQDITPYRKNMGWEAPQINGVTVIVSPDAARVRELVQTHRDAIHIIGGIKVGAMLTTAFDECIRQGCKVGVMTEPYNHEGLKGKLRTLKYLYFGLRYFKHIQFVLAIGKLGIEQYTRLGYSKEKLFPWAYFITVPTAPRAATTTKNIRIIYAGRLEPAKGISRFMNELLQHSSTGYTLDIYGTGADEAAMKQQVANASLQDSIRFFPFLKYDELLQQYAAYDWVVLPSAGKDGWGVIVSEGLLNGLKAMCSNICGVSRVIANGRNGMVFDWAVPGSCRQAIATMLEDKNFATAADVQQWATEGLSAAAGADYFMQITDNIYNNQPRPGIPWEQHRI